MGFDFGSIGNWVDPIGSIGKQIGIPGVSIGQIGGGLGLGGGGSGGGNPGYVDPGARPELAPFESARNADGTIKSVYQATDQYDPRAINAMRDTALRDPGTQSRWAMLAGNNAANQIGQQQASGLAGAQNNLAMQGGLRTGARERLQNNNMVGGLQNKQNAYNQIAMQDEQNRLNSQNQLAGQEASLANYKTGIQNTNTGYALNDITQQRGYDMGKYSEAMKAWAAQNTANAMPQNTDKGFLGNLFSF
jgi:hypothetical protein